MLRAPKCSQWRWGGDRWRWAVSLASQPRKGTVADMEWCSMMPSSFCYFPTSKRRQSYTPHFFGWWRVDCTTVPWQSPSHAYTHNATLTSGDWYALVTFLLGRSLVVLENLVVDGGLHTRHVMYSMYAYRCMCKMLYWTIHNRRQSGSTRERYDFAICACKSWIPLDLSCRRPGRKPGLRHKFVGDLVCDLVSDEFDLTEFRHNYKTLLPRGPWLRLA